ncbi:activity-regulated cytoskeleton-associated protein-like [Drosophila gunungcola]|uniref:activity-regulated cytoskeleton-associated protein-like n=1 Tax=Drosophila gunungcola TaxID=103775 RepID=UPI0022E35C3C|nr:activity-regulated cytoskeleton-associated protein-like [Drosophila gunungcola]
MGPLKQQVELLQMQEVAKDGSDSRHSSRQDEKDRRSTGTKSKYSTGVPPASQHAQRPQSLDENQYSAQSEPIQRSPTFEDGRALRQQAERDSEGRFTRQSRCSWDEVLDNFHHLVRGKAAEWYWQFVRERPPEVWEYLKDEIVARFRGVGGEFERLRALHERQQRPGESVEDYFGAMRRLSTRLTQPMSESDMIRVIKKRLAEDIARYVYAVRVRSVEQLREECLEVEDTFVRREPRPAYRPSQKFSSSGKRVEEIVPEPESQDKEEEVI